MALAKSTPKPGQICDFGFPLSPLLYKTAADSAAYPLVQQQDRAVKLWQLEIIPIPLSKYDHEQAIPNRWARKNDE